jgi:hypothetical protein
LYKQVAYLQQQTASDVEITQKSCPSYGSFHIVELYDIHPEGKLLMQLMQQYHAKQA